ncbi:MAG: BlaI/MecI/CopY family transcriptional regulator [bacterium]|jgi:predicted transcriptional regulator|nr:BlaI/MecI/CopY family transcriptional regulator [bacterium]
MTGTGWRPGSLLVPGLGPLESALMLVLWRASSPLKVAEVAERLDYPRPLAYSSVAAVLVNLCGKDMARRARDHNCWRYSAARSPHTYLNDLTRHMSTLISAIQVPDEPGGS